MRSAVIFPVSSGVNSPRVSPILTMKWQLCTGSAWRWSSKTASFGATRRLPPPRSAALLALNPGFAVHPACHSRDQLFLLAVFSRVARRFALQHSTNRLCLNLCLCWGPKEAGGGRGNEKRREREGEKGGFLRLPPAPVFGAICPGINGC